MSHADGPKLAKMKYREIGAIDEEAPGLLMLIRDPAQGDKPFALKTFDVEEEADAVGMQRAAASAAACPKLNHHAVGAYFEYRPKKSWFRTTGGELLMEYVDGRSLDNLDGATVPQWVLIFHEIASALSHMHRRKVLHGDLKPSHVMLARNGKVKVFGYGLNLVEDPVDALGAPRYSAPEYKESNKPSERADVYALGALMYHCLTGKPPGAGPKAAGKKAEGDDKGSSVTPPANLNPQVPPALSNLVIACLHPKAASRPGSPYDVQQKLVEIATALKVDPEDTETLAGLAAPSA